LPPDYYWRRSPEQLVRKSELENGGAQSPFSGAKKEAGAGRAPAPSSTARRLRVSGLNLGRILTSIARINDVGSSCYTQAPPMRLSHEDFENDRRRSDYGQDIRLIEVAAELAKVTAVEIVRKNSRCEPVGAGLRLACRVCLGLKRDVRVVDSSRKLRAFRTSLDQ
jgi:hypothetical protein